MLLWAIIIHLLADWPLQTEWMAAHKSNLTHPAAWVHSGVHTALLLLILTWPLALLVGVTHLLIDMPSVALVDGPCEAHAVHHAALRGCGTLDGSGVPHHCLGCGRAPLCVVPSIDAAMNQATMDDNLLAYLPMDRRHAMAAGRSLPHAAQGAALFADISGFTPLTEALVRELGPQRGAEELTSYINRVYDALIDEIHRWRGSVIAFAGDAVTCWFDDADTPGLGAQRAVAAALAMQAAMDAFAAIATPFGSEVSLSMKAAVAAGPVRRFLVGDPAVRVIDAIAGRTLERLAAAEHEAAR
ncbi:MAG: hypothetical protein R2854_15585 [Caldilineaceae bacterium]